MRNSTMTKRIKKAEYSLISVPWKKTFVFVKVRMLDDLQIQAIGNFSLIKKDTKPPSNDWRAVVFNLDIQHDLVRAALISPTYEQIFKLIGNSSFNKETEEKFKECQKEINAMTKGPEKTELEKKTASLRILFDLVLPNDFTAAISEYVLGKNRTDIELVTHDILLNCAIMQKRSGGRPSDYCDGKLSPFNKRDIDINAYEVFDKYIENLKKAGGQ